MMVKDMLIADGNNVWIAVGEPYLNGDGIWTIDTIY